MASGIRRPGEFCWVNILTPRPAEAREFFGRVLGWTYFEMPGMGHGMQVGGHNIGGLFDPHGPNTPPGLPPCIGVMVKVEDADRVRERVESLGGRTKPAFDVGENGRMAVCFDPAGANFDVWQPKSKPGTDVDSRLHGAPSWFEAMTTDVAGATEFYCRLFGWTAEVKPMPGMEYTVFRNGGTDAAGMMKVPHEGIPPHWGTYFTVDDADEAAKVAEGLGAQLFVPPMDIPGVGRFCGIVSPQGVRFYAIQYPPLQGA
jgi:predicted enzyme related to lactoylglutathione lyase